MKQRVRTSAVVVHNNKILTFFAIDPSSGLEYHFLPGGKIDSDETAPEAAERECLEETGYQIKVIPETCIDSEYRFTWDGDEYNCLTFFYKATLLKPFAAPQKVQDQKYNKGVAWVPISQIDSVFSYTDEIKQAIQQLVL